MTANLLTLLSEDEEAVEVVEVEVEVVCQEAVAVEVEVAALLSKEDLARARDNSCPSFIRFFASLGLFTSTLLSFTLDMYALLQSL